MGLETLGILSRLKVFALERVALCLSLKSLSKSLLLELWSCSYLERKPFCKLKNLNHEVILDLGWALHPLAGFLVRERRGVFEIKPHRHREGGHVRMGTDTGVRYLQAKNTKASLHC